AEFVDSAAALDIDEYVGKLAILHHYVLGGLVSSSTDAYRILPHVDRLWRRRRAREQDLPGHCPFVARGLEGRLLRSHATTASIGVVRRLGATANDDQCRYRQQRKTQCYSL